jgi:hydrogenase maturation factor
VNEDGVSGGGVNELRGSDLRDADLAGDLAAAALTLARAFATGATMWCVAPGTPAHARHVAVEFVHPVIVGKRALPAVSVDGPALLERLRLVARPGDVVVVVAGADDPVAGRVLRRAEPWGLTSVWIGTGPRPAAVADHILWLADADAGAGDVVLVYHLLWELTHVVFEHPGLLEPDGAPACTAVSRSGDVCITCSDEGRVAEVAEVLGGAGTRARVIAAGHDETVDTTLVTPVARGDLVLVHAGTAIAVLDEVQA